MEGRVQKSHTKVLLLFHFRSCERVAHGSLEAPFGGGYRLSRETVLRRIDVGQLPLAKHYGRGPSRRPRPHAA